MLRMSFLILKIKLMEQMTSICDMVDQIMQKKEEEKRIAKDQASKDRYWKIPMMEHLDSIQQGIGRLNKLEEVIDVDQTEIEFDLEDILQIQDVILREKLLNISRLVTNIESLNDNPTPDRVLKSPFSFPIPVTNSDSFFEIEPGQGGLISIVISNNSNDPLLEFPEFESFHSDFYDDPSFPRPPPEPPYVKIRLIIETNAPVKNNFDELNEDECFDPGGDEIDVKDDDSFTFVIRTFLPFLTYPEVSPLPSSTKNKDTIFDPGIST
ncbi:hypothetical protein Tco_0153668 [Tanacetum coccineum]